MILKKQKTFNSQAQKLRRAKFDLAQAVNEIKTYDIPIENKNKAIEISKLPINLKNRSNDADKRLQEGLRGLGRFISSKPDESGIGNRGWAAEKGDLNSYSYIHNKLSKQALSKEKELLKKSDSMGVKIPVEKGDYIRKTARKLVDREAKLELEKKAKAKAENAIKAESKFDTKKAEILAKRAKLANLKKAGNTAGKIAAGVGVAAGIGYGGYKAYQHFKNKKKDDSTKG